MQALMGARPWVVTGVRASAGAVIPKAAVARTANDAAASCFLTFIFGRAGASPGTLMVAVSDTGPTVSHQCPPAVNVRPTPPQ